MMEKLKCKTVKVAGNMLKLYEVGEERDIPKVVKEKAAAYSIKNWASDDKPREKLISKGRSSLSNAELLAVLIRSGTPRKNALDLAREILVSADNSLNRIARMDVADLCRFDGIGEAKAVSIIVALELGLRRGGEREEERPSIRQAVQVFDLMRPELGDLTHEEFWAIHLDRANHVIKKQKISQGGLSGTTIDQRLIFRECYENKSSALILCHNHPAGSKKPSKEDIDLTLSIRDSCATLGFKLLDHIIVRQNAYFSFAEEGIL